MALEIGALQFPTSPKGDWDRELAKAVEMTRDVKPGEVVAFAQTPGVWELTTEMNAMWGSLLRGVKTVNGYTGFFPPERWIGKECAEIERRLVSGSLLYPALGVDLHQVKVRAFGFDAGCEKRIAEHLSDLSVGRGVRYAVSDASSPNKLLFLRGWNQPEPWGTWSQGKRAALAFFVSEGEKPAHMVIEANFLTNGKNSQRVAVRVNGKPVYEGTFKEYSGEFAFDLSAQAGKNVIEFDLPDATTPKRLGMNEDGRTLGIGIKAVRFE